MIRLEFIRLAWETVRGHKLRSALTLLGIVIGVFAIIVSVTAVTALEAKIVQTVESFGVTTFTISRGDRWVRTGTGWRPRKNLTYDDMAQYAERAQVVKAISPQMAVTGNVEARFGGRKTDKIVTPLGVNEHWIANNGFEIVSGRNLTDMDVLLRRPVAVIGSEIDEALFPSVTAVNKDVVIGGYRYNVIGVLKEKGETFGENVDRIALVPITRMISAYSAGHRGIQIKAAAARMEHLEEAMEEAIGIMRVIRGVGPGEENDFEIESNESFIEEFRGVTQKIAAVAAAVGLITLLTAGVGIMNIMLVSVAERTREIGVRKAVGARRGDILSQFLYEALFLCQIGGLVGIVVGVLGGNVLKFVFDTPFVFPWPWAIGAVLAVSAIALIFGVYPAYKAAGLDPIEALRHE